MTHPPLRYTARYIAHRYRPVMTSDERAIAFDTFLATIEDGDTLKNACSAAGIAWGSVSRWIATDSDYAARYARARSSSADFYADKAQDAVEGAYDRDTSAVARVKSEHYRWRAAVANPKAYGDKVQHDVSGTVGVLHLDALRAVRTTASAELSLPVHEMPRISTLDASTVTSEAETGL